MNNKLLPGPGRSRWLALAGLALVLTASQCRLSSPDVRGTESDRGTGALTVLIDPDGMKTLVPPLEMDPAAYVVCGQGPRGATFSERTAAAAVTIPDLAWGDWIVEVEARNARDIPIGRGQGAVTVQAGRTESLSIPVEPLEGEGSLLLEVVWPGDRTADPSVSGRLLPAVGGRIELQFGITGPGTAACSAAGIPAGYYTLELRLLDGGDPVTGAVEIVRILKEQTTSGRIEFPSIDIAEGGVTLSVVPRLDDPVEITLSGCAAELHPGDSMTVTAAVPPATGQTVFAWYLNGEAAADGPSHTLGSALASGSHRLDVTAVTADLRRAGSASHVFRVLPSLPGEITLEWNENPEENLGGYRLYSGFSSRNYSAMQEVGNRTTCTLTGLEPGTTYYFALTAYSRSGLESGFSDELVYESPPAGS
jgi:hypothetical protein